MSIDAREKKIIPFEKLSDVRKKHQQERIVHCHGVFDVLHAGHLAYFESAKKFGDILIVTITADQYVNKGPGRPYFNSNIRANMLAALEIVDYVSVSHYPTAVSCIEQLSPNFYVKGPDYRDKAQDITGAIFEEEKATESHGGKMVFTSDESYSSSYLINNFFPAWTDDQLATINKVKEVGGIRKIESILADLEKLQVIIIGEPIVDTYVFCKAEAISSKSPSISARYLYQEDYTGGSLAIANHLCDFLGEVRLLTTHGGEPWFDELLKAKLDARVKLQAQIVQGIPTPRKTRYIADDKVQRLFELTDIKAEQWKHHDTQYFIQEMMSATKSVDGAIIADFGHGLFENGVLEATKDISTFIGLNVQTNSSNFGFNPYTKHKRFSYLSIDLKEARMAFQDRYSSHLDLLKKVHSSCKKQNASVSMTLGPMGAYYLPKSSQGEIISPAFTDSVVDAVGAGDAFFAITSMLVKVGAPDVMVPFLGNVFAGLKTKIMGNKSAVSKAQFMKAVTSILK